MARAVSVERAKQVEAEELSDRYGRFAASPLERGFGQTLGNALRRILLSSIPGAAITSVRIDGVLHEFSTIPNCLEDVTEVVLNLKKVTLRVHADSHKDMHLKVKGRKDGKVKKEVKAGDIEHNGDVEVINPDLHIATLTDKGRLEMELGVDVGTGYVSTERLKGKKLPLGTILIDALFSPVTRVDYRVDKTRVGERTDYDRLIVEVWTNGAIHPQEALSQAARILRDHTDLFIRPVEGAEESEEARQEKERHRIRKLLPTRVDEIELSVRAKNCLERENIKYLRELVVKTDQEMLKYKNFGKKSLQEIKDVLKGFGLGLGMEISKYLSGPEPKEKADEA